MTNSIVNKILLVFKVPFTGRMTRRWYAASMVGTLYILIYVLACDSSFMIIIATINILTTWRRLHDIDVPGFPILIPWALYAIACLFVEPSPSPRNMHGVPTLLFTFIIVCSLLLMLSPGDPGANTYGDNPRNTSILPHDLDLNNDNSNPDNKKRDYYDRFKW